MDQTMVSWLGHGCAVGPWMLSAQNASDHGRYQAPPSHGPAPVSKLQFLMPADAPASDACWLLMRAVSDAKFLRRG